MNLKKLVGEEATHDNKKDNKSIFSFCHSKKVHYVELSVANQVMLQSEDKEDYVKRTAEQFIKWESNVVICPRQ